MPLEIRYRNTEKNNTMNNIVQEEYFKIKKIYPRIKLCHVTIEKPQARQHTARPYRVSLIISVPKHGEIVVKTPATSLLKSHVSLEKEIRDIFERMERKLIKIKKKYVSGIKRHRIETCRHRKQVLYEQGYRAEENTVIVQEE